MTRAFDPEDGERHLQATQYRVVLDGGWNIADRVARSYDLEGMRVGTVAAGRIGLAVLSRLAPFDVRLHYTDRHRLPEETERELGLVFHPSAEDMVPHCDVVTINAPLHPETEGLFGDKLLGEMKRGAYLINTARAKIVDRGAVERALREGQLAGYAGDVWYRPARPARPPLADHAPPRHDPPHISGSSLSAQARYAAGTREILESWFTGRPIRDEYLITDGSGLAGTGAHSYSVNGWPPGSAPAPPGGLGNQHGDAQGQRGDDQGCRHRPADVRGRRLGDLHAERHHQHDVGHEQWNDEHACPHGTPFGRPRLHPGIDLNAFKWWSGCSPLNPGRPMFPGVRCEPGTTIRTARGSHQVGAKCSHDPRGKYANHP
ncbi:NAD(P)-dependent oxidoreductase [Streptomyces phaeolivaceus]|uniref:NAD(P)-dependent oxidoreductase n=1 Tax=Streptomyces phaeolivaceus TaxID=2653200 RepID=UPI0021F80759|nr:NAD(P)-dependent oxidoreductase [Streptomyces phaeolivaceus]